MRISLCDTPVSYKLFEEMTLAEALFCYQAKLRSKLEERITKVTDRMFLASILGVQDLSSLESEAEELQQRYDELCFTRPVEAEKEPEMNQDDKIRLFLSRTGIKHRQESTNA